jgi:hypothetical protein
MFEEVATTCFYCHKLIEPLSDGMFYENPRTKKPLGFHNGKCYDEARKDSKKYGIDDFKSFYGPGDVDRSK